MLTSIASKSYPVLLSLKALKPKNAQYTVAPPWSTHQAQMERKLSIRLSHA